jgi:hypothetical protein
MSEELAEGVFAALEELAKTFVLAAVVWWLFLVLAWPFISVSRLVFFALSFGRIRPGYRESLDHQGITLLALLLFLPSLFLFHLVIGARLYGNLAG